MWETEESNEFGVFKSQNLPVLRIQLDVTFAQSKISYIQCMTFKFEALFRKVNRDAMFDSSFSIPYLSL